MTKKQKREAANKGRQKIANYKAMRNKIKFLFPSVSISGLRLGDILNIYIELFNPDMNDEIRNSNRWRLKIEYLAHCGEFKGYYKKSRNRAKKRSGHKTYTDYYKFIDSKTWYKIRKEILKRDNHRCVHCNKPAKQVHHKQYVFPFGTETPDILESVCFECHKIIHGLYEPEMPEF